MMLKHPMLRTFALLSCLSAIAACGDDEPPPKVTEGDGGGGSGGGGSGGTGGTGGVPPETWDLDRSKPLSDVAPEFTEAEHPLAPGAVLADLKAPLPTNATWMNFALGEGDQRINAAPYDLKAVRQALSISRPAVAVESKAVTSADLTQLALSARQAFSGHTVKSADLLSVTVEWAAPGGTMTAPIVYGMPYVTATYDGLAPSVRAGDGVAITEVNGESTSPTTVTGDRFEISLNNGQTWVLYAFPEISLEWDALSMTADEPYEGSLRLALVPGPNAAAELDDHAAVIPVGGDIEASVTEDEATVRFVWKTEGEGELLTMALPHHLDHLNMFKPADVSYPTVIGQMKGMSGASWELKYPLSTIGWDAPRRVSDEWGEAVVAALEEDKGFMPDEAVAGTDPYFGGKQLAKLARLAQIAEVVGKADLAEELRARLKSRLNPWLNGQNDNPLVYDTTWGGLVTTNGLTDQAADFGQGYYNDHHFHYGYFLYAAAVLAKSDEAWREEYGDKALWLVRDIANPSAKDKFFTPFRNMDWFRGHSWASGLFPFADGRNQESTSEAVNAWYSMQLLGEALENEDVENLGRVLLALETASAQTYWQVTADSTVYPEPFKNNGAVGVLWSTKADFGTWFGANPEYVYGIQLLPITPISESLISKDWIQDAWPAISDSTPDAEDPWKAFLIAAHATVDKEAAWEDAQTLTELDDGLSRTALLYWIATRP
ncbi:glycosyl hydrolase [Sorangium sp. So ce381]|uniref:glycosyl hydrolase n=1 Tax=Sorangium sp. So ce381 TaxID=3133307 RepID=UPI003F5B7018